MRPSSPRYKLLSSSPSTSLKIISISVLLIYVFLHTIVYVYSIFAVLDEKRILDKKELFDGPLVMNDKSKKAIYGRKGVHTAVAVIRPGELNKMEANSKELRVSEAFYRELISTAREKLKKMNDSRTEERFVYFTFVNDAYTELTMNWLCNVAPFQNTLDRTIIATSSQRLHGVVKRYHPTVSCILLTFPSSFSKPLDWGKKAYREWLKMRAQILLRLTMSSIPFVLFETDSSWFRDPFHLFGNATLIDDADIVVPAKGTIAKGQTLTFDPMLVYPTNASIYMFEEMNRRLEQMKKAYDQDILDYLCRIQYRGVVCRTFEWSEISDGKWFKMSDTDRSRTHPYIVNNNYYVGVKNKMSRQALHKLWLLEPTSLRCSVDRRNRMFLVHGEEWEKHRNGGTRNGSKSS